MEMEASAAGLELQLTLLHSSLTGGRLGTLTDPFPQAFEAGPDEATSTERRDFDALLSTVASLPPAAAVVERRNQLTEQQRQVVSWLQSLVKVRPTPVDVDPRASAIRPSHQFVVQDHRSISRQERWAALAEQHGVAKVYHGSAVENFHSIINNGKPVDAIRRDESAAYSARVSFCAACLAHAFALQASRITPARSGSELVPRLATGFICQTRCNWLRLSPRSSQRRGVCGPELVSVVKSAVLLCVKCCCTLMCGGRVSTCARPIS